eukprot:m.13326 g.13326  ORF g.13326 m.13326 type:complete len:310 (+) comp4140_c0_seq1:122-1051(+)
MDLSQSIIDQLADDETDVSSPREPYKDEILMCGFLVKLGGKRHSWKKRWIVVKGSGVLEYFKHCPTASKPITEMTPSGTINLQRDCIELMRHDLCSMIINGEVDMPHSDFFKGVTLPQGITWPSVFGIRTTSRLWLMFAPEGDCGAWITGLSDVCKTCELFEGVNATPPVARRLSSSNKQSSSEYRRRSSSSPPTSPSHTNRRWSLFSRRSRSNSRSDILQNEDGENEGTDSKQPQHGKPSTSSLPNHPATILEDDEQIHSLTISTLTIGSSLKMSKDSCENNSCATSVLNEEKEVGIERNDSINGVLM